MSSEKEIKKLMRMLQGLSSDSSNNENKKSRKGKRKGKKQESSNESSSNDNVPWYGRVPGASAKASGAAGKASGQGASGQGASGQGSSASGAPSADEKIKAAFALYETTKEDVKKLGEKGKDTIRKKFLKIAQKNHPDKWSNKPNNNTKKAATERYKKYSEARDIINKEMGWADNFKPEKEGGTRKRNRRNRKTRKN